MVTIPFLGYFALYFRRNIIKELNQKGEDYRKILRIGELEAPTMKLLPSTGINTRSLRFGLAGNDWRGEELL